MAKKIYAVRNGRTVGIFNTWDECKQSIDGFSGAEYKSFSSEEDAKNYLNNINSLSPSLEVVPENSESVIAYVDGSYDEKVQKYGFGCVIITPNNGIIKDSGCDNKPDGIAARNIAGELLGAIHVIRWAINNGYSYIEIRYDYEGISKWFTGEWKAKNTVAKSYVEEMNKMKGAININFKKVVAHSNNKYNDEADRLAGEAIKSGKKIPIARGEYWVRTDGIEHNDLNAIIELIQEEYPNLKHTSSNIPYGQKIELFLNKEKVIINHYDTKRLVINGKPQTLFSAIFSYVTELVDLEKIPEIYNSAFQIEIPKDQVETAFQSLLPHAYNKLSDKMARVLHQAIYNLNIHGDMFDSSFLVQPAGRVLEGHLKRILAENKVITEDTDLKTCKFEMFDKRGNRYYLRSGCVGSASSDMIEYIGNCYSFFCNNRHVLFHWDDPMAPIDTTRIIDNVHDAHQIIRKTLAIIDEYYKIDR